MQTVFSLYSVSWLSVAWYTTVCIRKSHSVNYCRLTVPTPRSESRWWRFGDDQELVRWQHRLVSSSPLTALKRFPLSSFHSPSLTGKPLEGFKWKWVDSTFSRQFLLGGSVPYYGAIAVFTNGPSDPARGETSPYFRTSSPIDPGVKSALRSGATVWKYHQVSFPEVS